ncbi:MAG: C45 family autoproteolytic acyltransferase/hydrolase [Candidatus Hodarchaeales archaeon]
MNPAINRLPGTNYEIGKEIGSNFKDQIHKGFKDSKGANRIFEQDRLYPELLDRTEKLGKKYFQKYMDEIRGIADGSSEDYRKILAVNFMHVFLRENRRNDLVADVSLVENCSTGIFKHPNSTIVCHNEELDPILGKYSYFLHYELPDGSSFLAFAYCGCIPGLAFGFNTHGIVKCCNSLYDPYKKLGIPRILFGRTVLEKAETLVDAVSIVQKYAPRAGGASYNFVSSRENQAVNVETTSISAVTTPVTDRYFRTNHYISRELKKHPLPPKSHVSVERYEAGIKLLHDVDKTEQGILRILSDPNVFVTPVRTQGVFCTTCTAVFNINKTIDLKVYPPKMGKEEHQYFSSKDLFENNL